MTVLQPLAVQHPSVWTATQQLSNKCEWCYHLSAQDLAEIDAALRHVQEDGLALTVSLALISADMLATSLPRRTEAVRTLTLPGSLRVGCHSRRIQASYTWPKAEAVRQGGSGWPWLPSYQRSARRPIHSCRKHHGLLGSKYLLGQHCASK